MSAGDDILRIERPARYMGGEWNSIIKDHDVQCRFLLAFPDTYEIGMSHLGIRILYDLVNQHEHLAAERVFAPWFDREEYLRRANEPLASLETARPAHSFDVIGFSLQTELDFTNVLNMLDLGGIPVKVDDRPDEAPIVIAGGPVAFNPEPLAAFIDLFHLGDAEEVLPELLTTVGQLRSTGHDRKAILEALAELDGVYVPSHFETEIDPDNGLQIVKHPDGKKAPFVTKAILENLDDFPFPAKIPVPNCAIVHDRAAVEISRGCDRGCRFCQAGVIYMPERQRSAQSVTNSILDSLKSTGYSEVSLSALTPNDYDGLSDLVCSLMDRFQEEGVSLSLASLSPSNLDEKLLQKISTVRKTGLTIAPEAGTQRMRDVINKGITEEQVLQTAGLAFELGWKLIKLYFMIGLPSETDEDILGIAELAKKVAGLKKGVTVKIGCASFIPKSHTPFQWVGMDSRDELQRKQNMLRNELRGTRIDIKFHDLGDSLLEGLLSRGDRRVAEVIYKGWEKGCRFDGWSDKLRMDLWEEAVEETDIDREMYVHRSLPPYSNLPWSHIDPGVTLEFLQREYQNALEAEVAVRCTPPNCAVCKACPPELLKEKWNDTATTELAVEVPPSTIKVQGEGTWYRLRFRKADALIAVGHLDLADVIQRTFRRAGISVAMSQGFHPQPRISIASALPLGMEGSNEYLEVLLIDSPETSELLDILNTASPDSLTFTAAQPRTGTKSLSALLAAADYRVVRTDGNEFLTEDIERFMALPELEWKRRHKGKIKRFDIRDKVLEMDAEDNLGELRIRISLGPGISAKPAEVLEAAFGLKPEHYTVLRENMLVEREGQLLPPM